MKRETSKQMLSRQARLRPSGNQAMCARRYAAAASMLEQILTLIAYPAQRLKTELTSLQYDIVMSIALIQDVDMLVQTRLDLCTLYSGHYNTKQNTHTVDCLSLLQNRIHSAATLANKGVRFQVKLPEAAGNELYISVDTYVWMHIAQNFLNNARKHTVKGSVTLSFLGQFECVLHFAVIDTGFGIPQHVIAQLFREEVTTGSERGVGLGLVSSRKFARAIGGDCWLHSTKMYTAQSRGGTEFRFCLPGRVVTSTFDTNQAEQQQLDLAALNTIGDIFIVEDSTIIRKSIITKLKNVAKAAKCSWKYHEHPTVESVLPAVEDFADRGDVIVTVDQNLDSAGGHFKGSDLLRTLQRHCFKGIIISASGDVNAAHEHKELGADLIWCVEGALCRGSFVTFRLCVLQG